MRSSLWLAAAAGWRWPRWSIAACGRDDERRMGEAKQRPRDHRQLDQARRAATRSAGPPPPTGRSSRAPRRTSPSCNAKGGVDGRKIEFVTLDDAYEPPKAVQNARRLIQQEQVFALFNTLGTAEQRRHLGLRQPAGGASAVRRHRSVDVGRRRKAHPWTIGWQPDYVTESQVYAEYLKQEKPNAKVAVLYQNDAFGKDLLNGFKKATEGTSIKVVAEESYEVTDPTVTLPDVEAGGLGRGHLPEHHHAQVRCPGDRGGRQARLEGAPHHQQRRGLEAAGASAGRAGQGPGADLHGLLQGSRRARSGPTTRR